MVAKVTPTLPSLDPNLLTGQSKDLWLRLPREFQNFLNDINGGRLARFEVFFFTGIPFEGGPQILPSRPDFVQEFWGIGTPNGYATNDLVSQALDDSQSPFPKNTIMVAQCYYGTLGLCLDEFDFGAVYYNWTHLPSIQEHLDRKRSQWESERLLTADSEVSNSQFYFSCERIANSWSTFLDQLRSSDRRPASSQDLPIYIYEDSYEQVKRKAAYFNLLVMVGNNPSKIQLNFIQSVGGGFLPDYWEESIREEASKEPALHVLNELFADSWVLDRMIDLISFDNPIDPSKYDIVLQFAHQCGYPKVEIDRSISDYQDLNIRKKKQQSPPLEEIVQDARERAIATIQSIYLVGISAGEVTPAQDEFYVLLAEQGGLVAKELQFIVQHYHGLRFTKTKFQIWNEQFKKDLKRFLEIEPSRQKGSLLNAKKLLEFLSEF
jgi:hypothetical protein